MIGLIGPQRSGKSTLAQHYAQQTQTTLVLTQTAQVFQRLGYSPQADHTFEVRMTLQEAILEALTEQYKQVDKLFVADRSPLDCLAYTLATTSNELSEDQSARLLDYAERCFEITNRHFGVIMLVQPGIPLVGDPTKARAEISYMEKINILIKGLMVDERLACLPTRLPRYVISLQERLLILAGVVTNAKLRFKHQNTADVRH